MAICVRSEGRVALLHDGEIVIGRSPYSTLILDHWSISRLHASFQRAGDQIVIKDLGSTNGTFVNGERIRGAVNVTPRDLIRVGDLSVVLEEVEGRTSGSTIERNLHPDPNVDTVELPVKPVR